MKTKIVALGIILCLSCTNMYGQGQWFPPNTNDTPKNLYDRNSTYWKKYKVLKRIGWVGLGVGAFAIAGGIIGGSFSFQGGHDTKVWEGIAYSGIGIAVATIPVFICADQKKEKAIVVSAGCGNLAAPLSAGKLACRQGIALQICF